MIIDLSKTAVQSAGTDIALCHSRATMSENASLEKRMAARSQIVFLNPMLAGRISSLAGKFEGLSGRPGSSAGLPSTMRSILAQVDLLLRLSRVGLTAP